MPDPITNRAAEILAKEKEIFAPVQGLYEVLVGEGLMSWINLETFLLLLQDDARFEVVGGLNEAVVLDEATTAGLEALGIFNGPWVFLHSRKVSAVDVIAELLRHLQEMNRALESAWHELPDDPEAEANLISLLMLGDMLERKVRTALERAVTDVLENIQGWLKMQDETRPPFVKP